MVIVCVVVECVLLVVWLGWLMGGLVVLVVVCEVVVFICGLVMLCVMLKFVCGEDWLQGSDGVLVCQFVIDLEIDYYVMLECFLVLEVMGSVDLCVELCYLCELVFVYGELDLCVLQEGIVLLENIDWCDMLVMLCLFNVWIVGCCDWLVYFDVMCWLVVCVQGDFYEIVYVGYVLFLGYVDVVVDVLWLLLEKV